MDYGLIILNPSVSVNEEFQIFVGNNLEFTSPSTGILLQGGTGTGNWTQTMNYGATIKLECCKFDTTLQATENE